MVSLALPTVTPPLVQYNRFSSTSFYSLVVVFSPGRSSSLCCAVARAKLPSSASAAPWQSCQAPKRDLGVCRGNSIPCMFWMPQSMCGCFPGLLCVTGCGSWYHRTRGLTAPWFSAKGKRQLLTSACSLNAVSDDIKGDIRRGWTESEGGWCLLMKCKVRVCSANCLESCSSRSRAVGFK